MRELAFLNKGIKISINDLTQKKEKKIEFKFEGGIVEFVNYLDEKKEKLQNKTQKGFKIAYKKIQNKAIGIKKN